MNKIRKLLISGLAVCVLGCTALGIAACNKSADFPAYRKPVDYVEPGDPGDEDFTGHYTIEVISSGGTILNGVKVNVMLDGKIVASTISIDGVVSFDLEPNEYELVVDESTLPTGYFMDGTVFKTSATSGKARVIASSKVQTSTAASSYRYNVGDVMYNFSYTDNNGDRQTLSDLLAEGSQYKAVVLNFWYIGCGPCRTEFPAIQSAYEAFSDKIKFIAFDKDDSLSAINQFREENGYTFDMVQDSGSLLSTQFRVSANPTTVVFDRYGVYAYRSQGTEPDKAKWLALFDNFTSDNYVQQPIQPDNPEDPDNPPTTDRVIPDIAEDDYSKFLTAINGEGADGKVIEYLGATTSESDKLYNWPWLLHTDDATGKQYVSTTNASHGNSFSILTVRINLNSGDYVSYEYFTSTETTMTGGDILYVLIDGKRVAEHSGISAEDENSDEQGWLRNRGVYIASRSRTIELAFCYMKDMLEDVGTDEVAIRNITIGNVETATEAIDAVTDTALGELNEAGTRYSQYVTPIYNKEDEYYHVKYDGDKDSILFLDYNQPALFAELHIGGETFTPHTYELQQTASFYFLVYWDYTTRATDPQNLMLTFGGSDKQSLSTIYINSYYTAQFSPTGLIPVTEELKKLVIEFTKEYCRVENIEYYEEMWLEFCRYYKHHGPAHTFGDDCLAITDPVPGMTFTNPYTAVEGKNTANVWNISNSGGGGVLFKFVPETTGVYYMYSKGVLGDDPSATVYNSQRRTIASFDNLISYDMFLRENLEDFEGYVVLTAGETYYLRVTKGLQETGEIDFYIEYKDESLDVLRVATTGNGLWTYNPELGIDFAYYIAVSTVYNEMDGYYHALDRNGEEGSVIYIDFIHPNFYEQNNHSLLWIIENGYFDFSKDYGPDYTSVMMQYYYKSIEGKDKNDVLYGMLEADEELVNYLCLFMDSTSTSKDMNSFQSGFWLSLATYFVHYGA